VFKRLKWIVKRKIKALGKIFLPRFIYHLLLLWFGTCRVKEYNQRVYDDLVTAGKNGVGSSWHYSIVFMLYQIRRYPVAVMVSASSDGDFLARVAELFGYTPVRGSRHRGGVSALKAMIERVKEGKNAGIIADGSQGPPLKAQAGAVMVASKTGNPMVPLAWSCSNYWTVKSWDRTVIPKPFSKVDFFYGDPIDVPTDLSAEEMEKYRLILEEKLLLLYKKAWAVYGKEAH